MRSAMRFSSPSIFAFENGMFSGSAQTRNWFPVCAETPPERRGTTSRITRSLRIRLRQREHRQDATLIAEVREILERADRPKAGRRIVEAHVRGHADARPSADAREHRDVLFA